MFGNQTITRDPVSVIPTVYTVYVNLGWEIAENFTVSMDPPVLSSTAWHAPDSINVSMSTPELLLIPWVSEAIADITLDDPELTDSFLLGDVQFKINVSMTDIQGGGVDLAPSWYIRAPFKTEFGFAFSVQDHLDNAIKCKHVDGAPRERDVDVLWGELESIEKDMEASWDFIPKKDRSVTAARASFEDSLDNKVLQGYTQPATKDLEKRLPWDRFGSRFSVDISQKYSYPAIKDLHKNIQWDTFDDIFQLFEAFTYAHPAWKDVDKTIWTGPNWFPKWCIRQYERIIGEVVFDFDSGAGNAYPQIFDAVQFGRNTPLAFNLPPAMVVTPPVRQLRGAYPSGLTFGGDAITRRFRDKDFVARGDYAGAVMNPPFISNPLVMRSRSLDFPQICFDGYRTGPKDSVHSTQAIPAEPTEPPDIRSYYIIMNTVSLKRVADNVAIPITTMEIGTDLDSWCWSLSATLRREVDLDLVRPSAGAPVEVEASINGNTWRFVIESYGHDRAFGSRSYSITGRSLSAYLADPYSLPASLLQSSQINAAQLASEVLTDSGFTSDFQLTDWLIPAGVYSVSNQTPMQQLLTIAAAAGGTVQSALSATTISLIPWYTALPWEWGAATVSATLPSYQSKRTSYTAKPQYSGVYVSGQSQGVMCLVKRTGTDGSDQPQMVTDSLITATEAGLQRGKRILADSGPRSVESIVAPLFDDPGLLKPGTIIDVVDNGTTWRGMVTSCRISAQRPTVTQSLDVLRYHGS